MNLRGMKTRSILRQGGEGCSMMSRLLLKIIDDIDDDIEIEFEEDRGVH